MDALVLVLSDPAGPIGQIMTNQAASIVIILNNYFHDVATATLLSSAVILHILWRQAEKGNPGDQLAFAHAYKPLTLFARVSLAWIIIGGVFRTIFFNFAEFIPASQKNIIPDLMIKHIVLVSAVIAGAILWRRFATLAKDVLAREAAGKQQ